MAASAGWRPLSPPAAAAAQAQAHPLLVDWLETGPVAPEALGRVLIVGDPAGAELFSGRAPAACVDSVARLRPGDGGYDLVAVLDWPGSGSDAADLANAVADGGTLVLIASVGHDETGTSSASVGTLSALGSAGLQLVALDDLSETEGTSGGRRRWVRATYQRVSR